jgi:hypothetical protein
MPTFEQRGERPRCVSAPLAPVIGDRDRLPRVST